MKERPILMTPENAQKVFEGKKTQTRRIIDPQPYFDESAGRWRWKQEKRLKMEWTYSATSQENLAEYLAQRKCPYGVVGEKLWIREALHRRGDVMCYFDGLPVQQEGLVWPSHIEKSTIPSIHMPRWACRSVVELTEVRVERVQDISEEDAIAEGCPKPEGVPIGPHFMANVFRDLWESINGAGSWEVNPWCWVLSFKKVAA